jgi:hypothetical protein
VVVPTVAVRSDKCRVCSSIAYVEDVNARLFDSQMQQVGDLRDAIAYAKSCGMAGTDRMIRRELRNHAAHVYLYIHGAPTAPGANRVQRVTVNDTPSEWLQVNQQAMNVGMDALRSLASRLGDGSLDTRDEIEIAKLGLAAAHKRGDHLTRGKLLRDQAEDLLRLASGLDDGAA